MRSLAYHRSNYSYSKASQRLLLQQFQTILSDLPPSEQGVQFLLEVITFIYEQTISYFVLKIVNSISKHLYVLLIYVIAHYILQLWECATNKNEIF